MSAILTRGRDDEKADSASGAFLRDTGIYWSGLVFVVSAQDSRRNLMRKPHWSDGNITVRLIQQKIVSGT
jgi:hypothetical protein